MAGNDEVVLAREDDCNEWSAKSRSATLFCALNFGKPTKSINFTRLISNYLKLRMRKLLNVLVVLMAMMLAACGEPEPTPDPTPDPDVEEQDKLYPDELYPAVEDRVVISYVTYYGSSIPDVRYMTHINYAFAELVVEDDVYQSFKLQGKTSRFQQIVNLKKKKPDLKILLSFTHGTSDDQYTEDNPFGGFSAMAKSDTDRKKFAQDCLDFCKEWGIDGIDIDWEFPGMSWSKDIAYDTSCDVENYTLLMKQLRETLGDDYLLTYAGYVFDMQNISGGGSRYINIAAVDPYVDWVNIMTYNMTSVAHSALNNPKLWVDCKRAVKHYTDKGIAPSKLVLGVPFFGWGEVTWSYKNIISKDKTKYKIDNWDAASSVPYVTEIATGERLCAYDNPKSIVMKGDFARGVGLKGMMSWQYDQDDAKRSLNTAMWQATMKK